MKLNYESPNTGEKLELLENGLFYDKINNQYFTIGQVVGERFDNDIKRLEYLKKELLNQTVRQDKHIISLSSEKDYNKQDIDSIMGKYYSDFRYNEMKNRIQKEKRKERDYNLNSRKLDILDMEVDEIAAAKSTSGSKDSDMYGSLNETLQGVNLEKESNPEYPLDSNELDNYMNTAIKDLNARLEAKEKINQMNNERIKDDILTNSPEYDMAIKKIDAMIEHIKKEKEEAIKNAKTELDEYLLAMQNENEKQRAA